MITVQAIQYTSDPQAWHALALALGLQERPGGSDAWTEFAGDGVLAIHRAEAPSVELHLLVDDLDAFAAAVSASGFDARRETLDDIGPIVIVDADGVAVSATVGTAPAPTGPLAALPIWYPNDLEGAGRLLDAVGLRRRLASDSGDWVDFVAAGGGMAALHRPGPARIELSFEYRGSLDELAARLETAGFAPTVVDEAYNRTLRVATPEGPDLWVNGVIEDEYGYTRAS
jgi:hypothetical protein